MVWRIHFTAEDLERIQVRPTLGPLAETVKAMSMLRCQQQSRVPYGQWHSQVRGRLTSQMTPLSALIPPGSKGVDLPILTGPASTMEKGVQALLAVPREQLLMEMEFTDRQHKLPAAIWEVAEDGGPARLQLAAAVVAAHQVLVEPYWTRIHACLHAEHVARLRTLATGGPDRLLASLQSQWVRWRPPVLEVLVPVDFDMPLDGRGIALVPSVFVGQAPSLHQNPNDPTAVPWLVMPPAGGITRWSSVTCGTTPGPRARRWPRWSAGTGPRCCAPSPMDALPPSSPTGWASRSRRPASTRRCCGTRA